MVLAMSLYDGMLKRAVLEIWAYREFTQGHNVFPIRSFRMISSNPCVRLVTPGTELKFPKTYSSSPIPSLMGGH